MAGFSLQAFSNLFDDNLYLRIANGYKVSFNKAYQKNKLIKKPLGTRIVIAELYLMNKKRETVRDCIIYEIPGKDKKGALNVMNVFLVLIMQ